MPNWCFNILRIEGPTDQLEEFKTRAEGRNPWLPAAKELDTAWAPPLRWLERVSTQYRGLRFELEYGEMGVDLAGKVTFHHDESTP